MVLVTLGHLLPLYSPYHQKKIRILNKRKKIAGDIIVLHKCAKNSYSHNIWLLRYRVRPTEIFVLLAHFLPFYSPNNQKKFLKKMKLAPAEMLSLYMFLPKMAVT